MTSNELRDKFLKFFESRGHKIVASSSLLPTDPSVLFTTAGMQQFSLYLSGKKDVMQDFGNKHLASCQKCFRTGDIEEIGDDTHHTFFEMLGNWSVGQNENGYFKEGAINFALNFLVNELKMDKSRFTITIFKGEGSIDKDTEAAQIWLKNGIPEERIKEFGKEDNFWGPTSNVGPCGPCSEIHYDRGEEFGCNRPECGPSCEYCKRFVEIWNLVFMQYNKNE
ncbi:MAG: alanine--tRNA ligase-related protein, partial [Candidatus Paceibacterota bacterium]